MTVSLSRRALAEFLGTGLLVAVVVGSGIAAQNLSSDRGLQLLENSVATAVALPVLILIFGSLSGSHFNPVISLADWVLGHLTHSGITTRDLAAYLPAQIAGAVCGCVLANAMFGVQQHLSVHQRSAAHLWLGEVVATAGLLLVVIGLARSGKASQTPWAVGAYIGAAYWFTSSTSFANPAVTVGRMFTNTFAGIAPGSAPAFIAAQIIGAGVGVGLALALYPQAGQVADDLVVPHHLDRKVEAIQ